MAHQFSDDPLTDLYTKYPSTLFDSIARYCREHTGSFDHALDVGCGTGESTVGLLNHYNKVTGADVNAAQIAKAPSTLAQHLEFVVSPAEELSFAENDSVNLLTVGQALPWIDRSRFYPEVERVLVKDGVLAVYGYGRVSLDSDEGSCLVTQFYNSIQGDNHWNTMRNHVDNNYTAIDAPDFLEFVRNDSVEMKRQMPLSKFIQYLGSWAACKLLSKDTASHQTHREIFTNRERRKNHQSVITGWSPTCDNGLLLQELHARLRELYSLDGTAPDPQIEAKWPLFLLMAQRK